jgi:hypothetical protein
MILDTAKGPIRVNAGGPVYTDSLGQAWSADTGYQQGFGNSTTASISGTSDPTLYQTEHYSTTGSLTYQFAVPNDSYTVRLKFAEIYYTSANQRVFNVAINGTTVQSNLDIFAAAGGANKAYDLSFPVTSSTGQVAITLTAVTGYPKINAIEIAPATFNPIRVNAGGPAYTDSLGQAWSADTGYQQGGSSSTTATITGTSDPTLYQTEHYSTTGSLTYQFSVANASYTAKLKFAEIYLHVGQSAGVQHSHQRDNGTVESGHLFGGGRGQQSVRSEFPRHGVRRPNGHHSDRGDGIPQDQCHRDHADKRDPGLHSGGFTIFAIGVGGREHQLYHHHNRPERVQRHGEFQRLGPAGAGDCEFQPHHVGG